MYNVKLQHQKFMSDGTCSFRYSHIFTVGIQQNQHQHSSSGLLYLLQQLWKKRENCINKIIINYS